MAKIVSLNYILAQLTVSVCLILTKFGMDILLDPKNKSAQEFLIYHKIQDGRRGPKVQNWPNLTPQWHFGSAFGSRSSDLKKKWHEHTSWPYKQVCARIYQLEQNRRWPPEVKGPKSTKFEPTNHISARHLDSVYPIWTKFCTPKTPKPQNPRNEKII